MESVRSAFHAQLATVMDTLLAAAVCEIAKIFESSLCEYQAELVQKSNEISILRAKREKVGRKQKAKGAGSDVDDIPTTESEECNTLNAPDNVQTLDVSGFIKEESSQETAAVKYKHAGSQSNLTSITVQASDIAEKGQKDSKSPPQHKANLSWDQNIYNASEESARENLQANGSNGSGPTSRCAVKKTSFTFDGTSNEDKDSTFPFLDQEPENHTSSHDLDGGQEMREPIIHTQRVPSFSSRDPLRPQLNLQTLPLRNMNSLCHPPAASVGNGRPYTCPYCTKCFTYPSHQRRHLLRHTGVRLHSCQFCEKSFLTPSELTVHTRTHTGERPFGCAQCGKRFARSGNLRAHQRDVHLGKRPFACSECGKRFAHRGNLRVHNHRVHQGDPYYLHQQSYMAPETD